MGAEEQEEQALVTGRPTTIIYSGDWPPEQAPRGLFKRYEVRGRVCEVIPVSYTHLTLPTICSV